MKTIRNRILIIIFMSVFLIKPIYAAGFQLYELGTPIIGTAGVGQAAVASDASTAFFNPAGMTALMGSQGMLGTQLLIPYTHFSKNNANTINGNNGGNAGTFTPGLGGFYVYNLMPKVKLGISLTSPFGGVLNYYNHWVGRYNVQQMTFYTLNLNPSLAFQLAKWLSLGIGSSIEYANLNQTVALRISPFLDGQAHLKVANTAPGYNVGALITPSQATKLGLAFRSQIVHNLTGNIDFLNISAHPSATTKMVMPANVIASISQIITNQITLLGEAGWADWSSMKNTIVRVDGFSAITPQHWHNTYRLGLGGQYQFLSSLLLQTGVSYDSSPTSASKRLPELPMDRQIRVGAGVQYPIAKVVLVGLSYEYINLGKAKIHNISSDGILSGSYSRNDMNVLQLSINVAC